MFFDRKYLAVMIVYTLICLGLSLAGIRSVGIIYVEEFRNMNIISFVYEFYLNIFNTVSPEASAKGFEGELAIIGVKLIICFSLINFCYNQIEASPWLVPITYLIAAPVFLYLFSIYIEPNNYVTFQSNSIAYLGSLIIGLSIGHAILADEKLITASDVFFSLIGVALLYSFEYTEFQSTLLVSMLAMIMLGIVSGVISVLIANRR